MPALPLLSSVTHRQSPYLSVPQFLIYHLRTVLMQGIKGIESLAIFIVPRKDPGKLSVCMFFELITTDVDTGHKLIF